MKNVVIYTRVSTDEQSNGYSLSDQKDRLEKYCNLKNYTIVQHYEDDFSAKTFERPEFQKFLSFAKKNRKIIDMFLIVKWDRFSRNMTDSLVMIRELDKLGIETQAIEQPVDLSIPENKLLLAFYITSPHVENDRRSLATIAGMRMAQRTGRFLNRAPFGYKNTIDSYRKPILVIDENNSALVKESFELYGTGIYSKDEVLKIMRKKGIKLCRASFHRMLHNPVYCGKIILKAYKNEPETILIGIHQPIISDELYNRVQHVVGNKRFSQIKPKCKKEELPLRGFLICPICGRTATGSASKGRNGKFFYYHCISKCKYRVRAENANMVFENWLDTISLKPQSVNLYLKFFEEIYKREKGNRKDEIIKLQNEIEKLKARILKTDVKFIDEMIDVQTYNNLKESFMKDMVQLQARKSDLEQVDFDFIQQLEFVFNFISKIGSSYRMAELEIKQKIIGSIFPKKLIFENSEYRTDEDSELVSLLLNQSDTLSISAPQTYLFSNQFKENIKKIYSIKNVVWH